MVSALWPSLGTGDMQGVTLAKQCHQHPGGGTSPRGCAPPRPRARAVPAAWSDHGCHQCSLCRDGYVGSPGSVGRQNGKQG